jgi:hypothetical protein
MAYEHSIRRYRNWYAKLVRLYSKPYYQRFGEGMEQTFNDLLRERAEEERGVFAYALWMFVETSAGIIRENTTFIIMRNKNIIRIALATAFLLLIPLIAMQFTSEVNWTLSDFVVAGALLFGTGLTYELIARKSGSIAYRFAVGIALAAALLLVWINLAVGIIGSENNPANLMYGGVLVVGILGAIIAHLQPRGMARTLLAMAIAQMFVPVIALVIAKPQVTLEPPGVVGVFGLNAFFAMLFAGSALLFRGSTLTK